jgi:thioester reductase-like protein
MSQPPPDLAQLSPLEKRRLLARLLQQEARVAPPPSSPKQRRTSPLDQFAVPVAALNAEVVLDPAICPAGLPVKCPTEPSHVFLTGATGFLGAFLLHELLQQTGATIHCLVRGADVDEGKRRIDRNLAAYVPDDDQRRSRVIPVVGDLSKPLLGLPPKQFDDLATEIDAIYHNGADVNWIYSYSRLKSANVIGTQEILRLASRCAVKPVHVVSSLSVFPLVGNPHGTVVREQDGLDHGGVLFGGYTQSKWVAEGLATIARSRGLPVAIYRPGVITGHSQTGAWNTGDFMSRLIKSWIELGSAPDLDGATDMTPVDYVSRAMVQLSLSKQALGNVFHLVNPRQIHLRDLVTWIHSTGYPIGLLPYDRWRTELLRCAGRNREQAMYSLLPLFSARNPDELVPGARNDLRPNAQNTVDQIGSIMAAQYAGGSVRFDDQQARQGLAGSGIMCPVVDRDLLARYLSYFVRTGFLGGPSGRLS